MTMTPKASANHSRLSFVWAAIVCGDGEAIEGVHPRPAAGCSPASLQVK